MLFSLAKGSILSSFSCISINRISFTSFLIVLLFKVFLLTMLLFSSGLNKFTWNQIWYIPLVSFSISCSWSSTRWMTTSHLRLSFLPYSFIRCIKSTVVSLNLSKFLSFLYSAIDNFRVTKVILLSFLLNFPTS